MVQPKDEGSGEADGNGPAQPCENNHQLTTLINLPAKGGPALLSSVIRASWDIIFLPSEQGNNTYSCNT